MAVTRGATVSTHTDFSDPVSSASFSHTVDTSTDLLLLYGMMRADSGISTTPSWSLGGGESFTLIQASTASGLPGDMRCWWWGLVSPTTGAGTIQNITVSSPLPPYIGMAALNYIGVSNATVAAATNVLEEVVNDDALGNTTFSSAGSSGNALVVGACGRGADMAVASIDSGFSELVDTETGGGSSTLDGALYVADLLNNAPQGPAVTWGTGDENAGIYLEVVAGAAATSDVSVVLKRIRGY